MHEALACGAQAQDYPSKPIHIIVPLAKLGAEPMPMAPAAFDAFIGGQHAVLGKLMRDAGAKPQ